VVHSTPVKINLDSLRSEIEEHLESRGIAVFHGYPHTRETPAVYWDTEHHPDYHDFVAVAERAGARLVTLYANEFSSELIDDAEQRLDSVPRDDRREIEQQLRKMRGYAGFICQIELSFDLAPRVYIFDLHTDWYKELNDLLDQIDDAEENGEEEDPLGGGYFSKN
jgi:hypothetical protein